MSDNIVKPELHFFRFLLIDLTGDKKVVTERISQFSCIQKTGGSISNPCVTCCTYIVRKCWGGGGGGGFILILLQYLNYLPLLVSNQ